MTTKELTQLRAAAEAVSSAVLSAYRQQSRDLPQEYRVDMAVHVIRSRRRSLVGSIASRRIAALALDSGILIGKNKIASSGLA